MCKYYGRSIYQIDTPRSVYEKKDLYKQQNMKVIYLIKILANIMYVATERSDYLAITSSI